MTIGINASQIVQMLRTGQVDPLQPYLVAGELDHVLLALGHVDADAAAHLQAIMQGGGDSNALLTALADAFRELSDEGAEQVALLLGAPSDRRRVQTLFSDRAREEAIRAVRGVESPLSEAIRGDFEREGNHVLDEAIAGILTLELGEGRMDASRMQALAQGLVDVVRDNLSRLVSCLTPRQESAIQTIARNSGISEEMAQIEYLANIALFKVLRDYYELQRVSDLPIGSHSGFVALTENGSLIASPPTTNSYRTLHYMRMPSRGISLRTGIYRGILERDVRVGHALRSTKLTTSLVVEIVIIPPERAHLFEEVYEMTGQGMSSIVNSTLGTRFHPVGR